ncbi:MAG TPA: Gfo/Idh/MocA family oxidoreductase [Bacteroidales bacterium]|nr:Gfo/Idh/MocA family oxidoreductase [Bacteroidales bacterium]
MSAIKTALASYGMSGQVFHGPLLETHNGFEIKKILERHHNYSKDKHSGATIVRSFQDVLNDKEIELIIINTPDYLHSEMALAALDAGKHIVIEKPFTLKTTDADKIIDKGIQKKLMVSVFQNRRWDGDFLTVKKVIKDKSLGRLVSFESHFDRYRNEIQDSWKEDNTVGAGTLYNLGSHMIDQALQLFGMPKFIFADVRALRSGSKVDDSFDIFMYYDNVKCFVRGSYLVKEQGPRYILHGTNGSFLKSGLDPQEEMLKAGNKPEGVDWGHDQPGLYGILNTDKDGNKRNQVPTIPGNYMLYYDNIYDHLRENQPLAVKAEESRDVTLIIESAYESAAKQKLITL